MTHEEIVRAAEDRSFVIHNYNGAETMYRRISCINWRYASEDEILRGYPKKFMQVELESMTSPSVTIADPRNVRLAAV